MKLQERLNASLRSFLEQAEGFANNAAVDEAAQGAEGHSAERLADECLDAEPEVHRSSGIASGSGGRESAAALGHAQARLLRGLRDDVVRAIKANVVSSADPALLVRLLPALLPFVEAGRHVTLSYDEVRMHALSLRWV